MFATPLPPDAPPAVPLRALVLGYAGLIPFVGGLGALALGGDTLHSTAALALAAYAALIATFLGGIHWGLALLQPVSAAPRFAWAVLPSIVAWGALLLPAPAGLLLLAALLLACYAVDHRVYPAYGLRRWLPLRLRLTGAAVFCCAVGAALA